MSKINNQENEKRIDEKYRKVLMHKVQKAQENNDFFKFYDLLSKNGIMVFDDFNAAKTNIGVFKFINELLSEHTKYFTGYFEFSDNEHPGDFKNGIICFYK